MKNFLFKCDSNYQTIKDTIENNLDKTLKIIDDSIIVDGIQSLKKLENNDRIVSYATVVDHRYSSPNSNEMNRIPIILGGAIILDQYPEQAKSLYNEEIALLAHFSLCGGLHEYIKLFNHDVLNGICKISKDNLDRLHYLEVVEDYYNMFYEEIISKENKKEVQNKLARFVSQINKDTFDYLYYSLNCKTMEYADKQGVRL